MEAKIHLNDNAMILIMMKKNWLKCQMQEKIVGKNEVKKVNQLENKEDKKEKKRKSLK